jgi:hypothetical protein
LARRPTPPFLCLPAAGPPGRYEPEGEPDPAGGAPELPDGGEPLPPEGVPLEPEPEPLPMFGQLWVEPEPDEVEPEPDELDEPEEPELDDGVVVEEFVLVLALEPVEPVLDVVAASATTAPPTTSPVVKAPNANALRRRIFMVVALSSRVVRPPVRAGNSTVRPAAVALRRMAAVGRWGFRSIA